MNTAVKVILGIVVVLIIAGGAYYAYTTMHAVSDSEASSSTAAVMTGSAAAAANPLPSGTSTTDTALTQDTAAIDAQLSGLDSDNAQTSASVSDQPVSQQ